MLSELKKALLIDKISFWIFTVTVLLLPFFFLPILAMPILIVKGTLLFVGISLSFCFWLVARLVDGKFKIPKSWLIWCGFAISLVFLISSLFSPVFSVSFWGQEFETGTFVSIFSMFIGLFLTSVFFNQIKSSIFLVIGLFFSFLIGFIFMLINFISQLAQFNFLLKWIPVNIVGSWNDFAIFAGLIAILSLASIEFLPISKKWKKLAYIWLVISLLVVILVNFSQLWIMLGVFSLLVFIYSMSIRDNLDSKKMDLEENAERKTRGAFPTASFLIVIVCLFFTLASSFFGGFLVKYVNLNNVDVRPSVTATFDIAKSSLQNNPILGSGPNLFVSQWLSYKPAEVNSSLFWKADFNSGFGTIPSYLVTTGILGFLFWIIFFFLFLREGSIGMIIKTKNKLDKQMIFALFLASLFLWIFAVTYVPGVVIFFLAFVFTGLFIGLLALNKKPIDFILFSFINDPRKSFFTILMLVALIIVSITGGYIMSEKLYATVLFEKASYGNVNDLLGVQKTENLLIRAVSVSPNDTFLRVLSSVYLAHLNLIVAENQSGSLDSAKQDLQDNLKKAEDSAILAVKSNPKNYQNFVSLGDVYSFVLPLGVAEAYQNAKSAYEQALVLNPKNPEILLFLANLEIGNKDNIKAISYLNQAIAIKPNYSDAFFSLGSLEYQSGNFVSASKNFENAVISDSSNINARYFMALSYSKSGRVDEAISQLELLAKVYPDNQEINSTLVGLKNLKLLPASINKDSVNDIKKNSSPTVKK